MRYIFLIFVFMGLSACATVNNSSYDHFRIDSVPQGASVTTSIETSYSKRKRRSGRKHTPEYLGCEPTPCAIALPRHSKFIATVNYPGYEPAEIFIRSSSSKGSFAGDMAATSATVAGTTAVSAVTAAAAMAVQAEITSIIITSLANSLTFGAVPVSSTAVQAASTTTIMASAVPPALALSGGMLLVDTASGANKNLYPNPVVLGLVPEGQAVKIDPLALLYREQLTLKLKEDELCIYTNLSDVAARKACDNAKLNVSKIRKQHKEVMKLIKKAQQEAAKAAKLEAKAPKLER